MPRDFLSTREGLACSREIRKRVGQALRATYEPDLGKSLPEHLTDLLQRLDEREREAGSGQLAHRSHGS